MDLKFYFDKYKSSNSYTATADKTITRVGLLLPIALLGYGLLIQFGIIPSVNNNVGFTGFAIIMAIWLAIGIWQTIRPGKTAIQSTIRLFEFYTMSGVYFLLISGVYNPFVACWPILMLASYTYFERTGLITGVIAFAFLIIADISIFHLNDPHIIVSDIMLFFTISITGVAIVTVTRTHEQRKAKLYKNMIKESLQRDRVAAIVNNLTDAIISTDTKGIIRVYNAACLALLDTNGNLNGKNIDSVLPLIDKDGSQISILAEFRGSKSVVRREDLNFVFPDGEKIRLETTYAPVRNGYSKALKTENQDGYVIILRDITKSKSTEEERDEFISVISHELRTPITITEGTISNLLELMGHPNVTNTMVKDSIAVAHDQVMLLANIVNDLSSLSRAERGADDDAEDVDIHDLMSELITHNSDEAKKRGLKLRLDLDHNINTVFVSRAYLSEMLQNLIINGIKYTKKGGVTIIVKQKSGIVTFAVRDTGIGISKSDQSKIFDKFYRSEDFHTRETGGTGLGLFVAARLATQMGTKIEVDSQIKVGSTFSFALPAKGTVGKVNE